MVSPPLGSIRIYLEKARPAFSRSWNEPNRFGRAAIRWSAARRASRELGIGFGELAIEGMERSGFGGRSRLGRYKEPR